jgi:hypothetical protein
MNYVKTYEEYEQVPVSSERTFPAAPYPRMYIHCVLDDLYDAVQAVYALRSMDISQGDIHLMPSWDYVEIVERKQQRQNRLAKMLTRFLTFLDEGFGDVYLHEALRGHHILAVRLSRNEQILKVHNVLASPHTRLIKYAGTWTVADLPPTRYESSTLAGLAEPSSRLKHFPVVHFSLRRSQPLMRTGDDSKPCQNDHMLG